MSKLSTEETLNLQRTFFNSGKTKEVDFRLKQLTLLKNLIERNETEILQTLKMDLNKPEFEGYLSEIGLLLKELDHIIKNIKKWSKPIRVSTPLIHFKSSAKICYEPFGSVLIIAPWNYPFQLLFSPLISAVAAGNCAILKPSELSSNMANLIERLINENFEPGYIHVFTGGPEVSQELLRERFDYIFFTGGAKIGKLVMEAAAKHLTPLTLELGGKSPCIVNADANLNVAAKRIAWGKFFNAGQTCLAPDYLLVHKDVKSELVTQLCIFFQSFFGKTNIFNGDYAKIITLSHFNRIKALLKEGKIIFGGELKEETLTISPTLIDEVTLEMAVMQEEIFGPVLPILSFKTNEELYSILKSIPDPLAMYIFSENQEFQNGILKNFRSGGVCINDTLLHASITDLPFGGIGNSGFSNYHGKIGFETFSHKRAVFQHATWFDSNLRYPPYGEKLGLAKRLLRFTL